MAYIPTRESEQSAGNTSTTPLAANTTFTGAWELNTYPDVMVDCVADVSGQLFFEFSNDGVNAITDPSLGYTLGPNIKENHITTKGPRYFRVRLVNGASAQSSLRLYTYYGDFKPNQVALNERVGRDFETFLTRPTDFGDDIIRGLRSGVKYAGEFGYRDTTTAAAGEQTLWAHNSNLTIMTAADTFDITYTASTDGAGGSATGASVLLITYLDEDFNEQSATHVLGSTGTDTTSFEGLGINQAVVVSSGSSDENVNDIVISDTTGGNTQAIIPATNSVSQQLVYHCPINVVPVMVYLRLTANRLGGGSNPKIDFKLRVYNRFVDTNYLVRRYTIDTNSTTEVLEKNKIAFSGRDVIYLTMDTDTNNTSAQGSFSIHQYAVD